MILCDTPGAKITNGTFSVVSPSSNTTTMASRPARQIRPGSEHWNPRVEPGIGLRQRPVMTVVDEIGGNLAHRRQRSLPDVSDERSGAHGPCRNIIDAAEA